MGLDRAIIVSGSSVRLSALKALTARRRPGILLHPAHPLSYDNLISGRPPEPAAFCLALLGLPTVEVSAMFTFLGKPSRTCTGISRRAFLTAGAVGVGGLTLPDLLRAEAAAGIRSSTKSIIN